VSGTSPCKNCGIAVEIDDPSKIEWMQSLGRTIRFKDGGEMMRDEERRYAFVTCPDCQKLHDQAVRLASDHPRVRQQLVSRYYAIIAIENTLFALEALDVKPKGFEIVFSTDARMLAATRLLGSHGDVRFSALWVPYVLAYDQSKRPWAEKRWGHLSDEKRVVLSADYVELLRGIAEKPQAFPPPAGGPRGCLMCGVGTVTALPSVQKVGGAWRGPYRAAPGTLGAGRTVSSKMIEGFLCPRCERASEAAGAIGHGAMEISILNFIGSARSPLWGDEELGGIAAWCALPAGTPPNDLPWSHMDTEPLKAKLSRRGRVLSRVS